MKLFIVTEGIKMTSVKIFKLSREFANQYPDITGLDFEQLKKKVARAYVTIRKTSYKGVPHEDAMNKAEYMDDFNAKLCAIDAFTDPSISTEDYAKIDTILQTGDNRAMYVAWDENTKDVAGLLQISNLNYKKYQEKRPQDLHTVYEKICTDLNFSSDEPDYPLIFAKVGKPQRSYQDNIHTKSALVRMALSDRENTSHLWAVGTTSARVQDLKDIGYAHEVASKLMDKSQAPCTIMIGEAESVSKACAKIADGGEASFGYLTLR